MNRAAAASRMESVVESKLFHRGVIALIFLNAIGMETYPYMQANYGGLLDLADRTILYLFTLDWSCASWPRNVRASSSKAAGTCLIS